MNRRSFMAELRSLLAFLDADDRDRVLRRYERMFNEAGEDGEAAIVRCFGSPVRQVLLIEREYRDSTARGEIPFADGDAAEVPVEEELEEEFIEEPEPEYEEIEELPEEPAEEPVEELVEEPAEEFVEEAEETEEVVPLEPEGTAGMPASAPVEPKIFSVLPDLDLDSLDLSLPDATVGNAEEMTTLMFGAVEEPPAAEPETESELASEPEYEEEFPAEETEKFPEESEGTAAEQPVETDDNAAVIAAIFGSMPENAGNEPEETAEPEAPEEGEEAEIPAEETADEAPEEPEETPAPEINAGEKTALEERYEEAAAEYEDILLEEESPEPEETEEPEELEESEPETEDEGEDEEQPEKRRRKPRTQKEPEKPRKASGGRKFAAVIVTIPMIAMWAVLFGLSVALGVIVFALGAVFCAVGVYFATYVFGGALTYMPDILLTAGGMLVAFSLTVLFLWAGICIAVTGCSLTVRLSKSIYRSILYLEKEEDDDE